jgi:AcrR family transcriptional regulator
MDELARLLWEPQAMPRRGPRPTLTLAAIARAGVEAADAEGLAALTMQRVAERLGVTKMALYRYVPGKAELVALMIEDGIGAPPQDRPAGWREALDGWARSMFDRFREHPWSLEATLGLRVLGPNELGWLEYAIAAMDGTGLSGAERFDVTITLLGHVRNLAQQLSAMAGPGTPSEAALEASIGRLIRGREDRFPAITAALASAAAGDQDQGLGFGLDRILDGVALLVAARSPRP